MVAGMARQLWGCVRPTRPYQRLAYRVGAVLIASGIVHVAALVVEGDGWQGAVTWRKPIVFGLSFGLTAWAIGWALGQLPVRRGIGWTVAGLISAGSLVEVGLITMQRWRGVASHFNDATSFDAAVFSMMGTAVLVVAVGVVAVLAWALLDLRPSPVAWWASITGFGLMLVGSRVGVEMIARGEAMLEATGQVPAAVVFGPAGSAKLAHAAGLHGIQVLILLAVVLMLGTHTAAVQRTMIRTASMAYTLLVVLITGQAYAGRSVWDLSPARAVVGAVAVLVLVGIGASALRSWVRSSRETVRMPA